MKVRLKVAIIIGVLVCAVCLAVFVVQTGPVKTRPLQIGEVDATHIGYRFSLQSQWDGRVVERPQSVHLYLIADGKREEVPYELSIDVMTGDPFVVFPHPPFAPYEHEVRVFRRRYYYLGKIPIPTGRSTEIWTTGVVTNAPGAMRGVQPSLRD